MRERGKGREEERAMETAKEREENGREEEMKKRVRGVWEQIITNN